MSTFTDLTSIPSDRPALLTDQLDAGEIRYFKPFDGVAALLGNGRFYRTCIIDGLLEHSPAEHVHWPSVPAEPPTR